MYGELESKLERNWNLNYDRLERTYGSRLKYLEEVWEIARPDQLQLRTRIKNGDRRRENLERIGEGKRGLDGAGIGKKKRRTRNRLLRQGTLRGNVVSNSRTQGGLRVLRRSGLNRTWLWGQGMVGQ